MSESGNSYNLSWTLMQVTNSRITVEITIFFFKTDLSIKDIKPLGDTLCSRIEASKLLRRKISLKFIYIFNIISIKIPVAI